ncbi:hypothetical protein GSY71_18370 [Pusillimonas sp. TS35]|nr:hypothetical protein [Pusillimonas sp. TS35]
MEERKQDIGSEEKEGKSNGSAEKTKDSARTANLKEVTEQQPLLRALITKAYREGHTMQHLADTLGVSYARLNQWRRAEGDIGNAQRPVLEAAARYLGIPTILVHVLSGRILLSDLFWPAEENLEKKVDSEIKALYDDPFLGAFTPKELASSESSIKLYVLFLYRELNSAGARRLDSGSGAWLRTIQDAALGQKSASFRMPS